VVKFFSQSRSTASRAPTTTIKRKYKSVTYVL